MKKLILIALIGVCFNGYGQTVVTDVCDFSKVKIMWVFTDSLIRRSDIRKPYKVYTKFKMLDTKDFLATHYELVDDNTGGIDLIYYKTLKEYIAVATNGAKKSFPVVKSLTF